jgi:prepilin-type N-terminal cleavage/methylation domain-containing protein
MTAAAERPAGSFAASAKAGRESGVRNARPPRRAFTLLEILLVLALLALLLGATVNVSAHLIGDKSLTADDVFWKALNAARKQALMSQQDVRLSFDVKTKSFVIDANAGPQTGADASAQASTGPGPGAQTFPVPSSDKLTVDFLSADKSNSSVLIGGEMLETGSMPFVTFYSDGTCSPFRVQFHLTGTARIIAIDPWTCAEVLEEKK